ncbi:MAG: hypothetical protein IPN92_15630 [Chromatiaceae bacterium]|nr:hypothetical protein [Chromatiaceae bacterium]
MELTRERAQLGATSDRLAMVLAASPVVLYSRRLDAPDWPLTWVSDNLARLLGYEVAAALAPDWWPAHLDPQDRQPALGQVLAAIAQAPGTGQPCGATAGQPRRRRHTPPGPGRDRGLAQ